MYFKKHGKKWKMLNEEGKCRDCNNTSSKFSHIILIYSLHCQLTLRYNNLYFKNCCYRRRIICTNWYVPIHWKWIESFRRISEAAGVSKQTSELFTGRWRKGTRSATAVGNSRIASFAHGMLIFSTLLRKILLIL